MIYDTYAYCTILYLYWYVIYRFLQCCNMFALEVGPCFSCCNIPLNFGDVVTVIAYTVRGMQIVWNLNTLCMPCTDSEWLPSYDKIDSIETMQKNQLCTSDHCMFPIAMAAGHAYTPRELFSFDLVPITTISFACLAFYTQIWVRPLD